MPRFFEDAANCFLEKAYVDRFCASVGLSTTYGISIFVWFLTLCRVVVFFRITIRLHVCLPLGRTPATHRRKERAETLGRSPATHRRKERAETLIPPLSARSDDPPAGLWRRMCSSWGLVPITPDSSRSADLVLHTGSDEGIPPVLIQALAAGRPVVAMRGGAAEVVEDRTCDLLARAGDYATLAENIRRLGASPELREQFGSRGRQRVDAMFSRASTTHISFKMYCSMLAR
jgi:glycosyltransferase involved in cell wall biosynthesis